MPVSCESESIVVVPRSETGQASCIERSENRSSSWRSKRFSKKGVNGGSSTSNTRPSGVFTSAQKHLADVCSLETGDDSRYRDRKRIISWAWRAVIQGKFETLFLYTKA